MLQKKLWALVAILAGAAVAYFVYNTQITHPDSKYAFHLGLDLSGGSRLVYKADVSQIDTANVKDSMAALRDVIERRINLFGVSETTVQIEQGNFATDGENRLIARGLPREDLLREGGRHGDKATVHRFPLQARR